jgi:hypothetical protein
MAAVAGGEMPWEEPRRRGAGGSLGRRGTTARERRRRGQEDKL